MNGENKTDNYCGFMCGPVVEDVQEVLDEIKLLSNYNPEFAIEFLDKLTKMLHDTRAELAPIINAA